MLHGHGDDLYRYSGIRMNFSSNIPSYADLSALEDYLCSRISLIRSYPEPSPGSLEQKIAESIGINPSEVMVTSGATEAIYLIAQCLSQTLPQGEGTYTVLHPTFSEYDSACQMQGMKKTPERADVCWLCNPNNPTGKVYDEGFVRQLACRHRWLVVDQSYEDYTLTKLPQLGDMPNVIVLHSMTKKYCIPGLRLGYVTAHAPVIAQLRCFCRPWAVNALALEAGHWLLNHQPHLIDMPAYLSEAQRLRTALNELPGIHADETQTNFMLCTIEGHTAAELKEYLAIHHGILVRDASNFPGLKPWHFRVAAQTPEEDDELIAAISNFKR